MGRHITTVVAGAAGTFGGNSADWTNSSASTATCTGGTKVVGGGAIITAGANAQAAIFSSGPNVTSGTPTGWTAIAVQLHNTGNGSRPTITAYVICGV